MLLYRWVKDDVERNYANQQHVIADDPVCYRPTYLYDIAVSQVPHYDFTCEHDYYDYYYDTASEYELVDYDETATGNGSDV